MDDFYDRLAPLYDLIFPDWDASIERQAGQLAGIIQRALGGRGPNRPRRGLRDRHPVDRSGEEGLRRHRLGPLRRGGRAGQGRGEAAGRRDRLLGLRHAGRPRPPRAAVRRGDRLRQLDPPPAERRRDPARPAADARLHPTRRRLPDHRPGLRPGGAGHGASSSRTACGTGTGCGT